MNNPIEIIMSIRPFGFRMIENEPRHRYISSVWTDGGSYEIHGKAGTKRYIGYSKREAMKLYNGLCKA